MKTAQSCDEVTQQDAGSYIRFEGRGIIDGLKGEPSKYDCYLVTGVDEEGIHLKGYRRRKGSYLPPCSFNQRAEIYTKDEFQQMPVYQ